MESQEEGTRRGGGRARGVNSKQLCRRGEAIRLLPIYHPSIGVELSIISYGTAAASGFLLGSSMSSS